MIQYRKIHKELILCFLILTVFTFPLSNSLKSIFLTLTSLFILLEPQLQKEMLASLKKPWVVAVFALFLVLLIGMYTGFADWKNKIVYFSKYLKILYLPLLALVFQDKKSRKFAVYAFLLSMFITILVSVFRDVGLTNLNKPLAIAGPFLNRIDTGLFVAFAAYLAALNAINALGYKRLVFVILSLLFSLYIVFVNGSRTGYLSFSVLFLVFLVQHISWRKLILCLPILCVLVGVTASQSPTLKFHLGEALKDLAQFQSGDKNTSLGYRLQFAQYAQKLFLERPLMGSGSAGFAYRFRQDAPLPAWGPKLGDPHNQYWSFAVDYGLLGLGLLFYFFYTLYQVSQNTVETRSMMQALLLVFLMANFCDSFLLLSSGGYFFIFFAALNLGESLTLAELKEKQVCLTGLESRC